jgi:cobaltochelatase CobN
MHRLATTPGSWNPSSSDVILIEQKPAPIIIITAADTDIQILSTVANQLPDNFPEIRVINLLQLQQQITIDSYAEDVLSTAKVIILRLLGGTAYWSYGLEVIEEIIKNSNAKLIVLPGDEKPDPNLISHSNISLKEVSLIWEYFNEGGLENYQNLLKYISSKFLNQNYSFNSPEKVPRVGIYKPHKDIYQTLYNSGHSQVGILFYRAHYLAANTKVIDALYQALIVRKLIPVPIFVSSLREPDVQNELLKYCSHGIEILLNTTSFSLAKIESETPQVELWEKLNVPVLQVILSSSSQEQWESGFQGLTPRDMAMNVALPEVDGRIITRAVSFKTLQFIITNRCD